MGERGEKRRGNGGEREKRRGNGGERGEEEGDGGERGEEEGNGGERRRERQVSREGPVVKKEEEGKEGNASIQSTLKNGVEKWLKTKIPAASSWLIWSSQCRPARDAAPVSLGTLASRL